jgi:hypothetical protein
MGYAMATDDDGCAYRYTEWVGYNYSGGGAGRGGQGCETCMAWDVNYGTELYNLTADPGELPWAIAPLQMYLNSK